MSDRQGVWVGPRPLDQRGFHTGAVSVKKSTLKFDMTPNGPHHSLTLSIIFAVYVRKI